MSHNTSYKTISGRTQKKCPARYLLKVSKSIFHVEEFVYNIIFTFWVFGKKFKRTSYEYKKITEA